MNWFGIHQDRITGLLLGVELELNQIHQDHTTALLLGVELELNQIHQDRTTGLYLDVKMKSRLKCHYWLVTEAVAVQ